MPFRVPIALEPIPIGSCGVACGTNLSTRGASSMREAPARVRRHWRIPEAQWERIQPVLPSRQPHPRGCHRPRVEDRRALDASFGVLCTGCPWQARPATGLCASRAAHRRVPAWTAAGGWLAGWAPGLRADDARPGLAWAWLARDGAMTKAPLGGNRWASTRPRAGRSGPSGAASPTTAACPGASPWRARLARRARGRGR
jgi:Putative transposase of IS4/5 family (DUF4096)